MVSQTGRHTGRSRGPSLYKQILAFIYLFSEAHMRSGEVIVSLKENRLLFQIIFFFTKAKCFSPKRSNRFTNGEIQSFKKAGTYSESGFKISLRTAYNAIGYLCYFSFLSLSDCLSINQILMRFFNRFLRTTSLTSFRKSFYRMIALCQGRKVTAKSVTEKTWNTG